MTPVDLLDACEMAKGQGLGWLTLTVPYRHHRGRIRLLPGVLARVVGSTDKVLIVSVESALITRYLIKHLSAIEAEAIAFAEAGEHDKAAAMLAQYVQVRDRLGVAGAWRSRV